jgi:anti-sigma regulatory factor (Ser/Thr protein kinase)
MSKEFSLETTAEHRSLKVIRNFFTDAVTNSFGPEDVVFLEMCINEVIENVIKHAYPAHAPGPVSIKLQVTDRELRTTITDRGRPFDLTAYTPINKQELVEQGIKGKLGIRAVKKICDKITYRRLKGKNRTVFVRKRTKKAVVLSGSEG